MYKTYKVRKAIVRPGVDGLWDGDIWKGVEEIRVDNYMGDEPEHKPDTRVKVLYDDESLYVIFKVEDNCLLARAENYQDGVCTDSCVEFFFTPSSDVEDGYFNLEVNCGGTALFRHQISREVGQKDVSAEDFEKVEMFHSADRIIDPERNGDASWVIEYKLPIEILSKYAKVDKPGAGVKWGANFYKCADNTSKPHWLTWSVVDKVEPDFHRPDFFGRLEFM